MKPSRKIGECVNLKKILPLLIIFALFAVPAAAQPFGPVKALFTNIQDLIGSGLDGISENPAIWMKVIFIILIFIVLYNLAFKKFMEHANKGSKIFFSLIIAIAMVAPIPNALVDAIFRELAIVGIIIYILLVFGIWYFVRSFTSAESASRGTYGFAVIIWLMALGLIYGIAEQVDIASIKTASGYMSLFAFICLLYYGYKTISPGGETAVAANAITEGAKATYQSGWVPGTQAWEGAKKAHQLDGIQRKITILDSASKQLQAITAKLTAQKLVNEDTKIKNQMVQVSNAIYNLLNEKLLKQVVHSSILTNLEKDLQTVEKEANAFASYDFRAMAAGKDTTRINNAVKLINAFFGQNQNLDKVIANYKKALGFS
ncbi:hypothetical protein HY492_04090 [Candidatus Woesearchaeota archaeon]|nr:hypothetical protein [Candidatus Woesearchaeota archaeon]